MLSVTAPQPHNPEFTHTEGSVLKICDTAVGEMSLAIAQIGTG